MAKKKKVVKKKSKYSRKPATLMTQGLKATKAIMDVAEQSAKAGKRAMYKGKITKAEKDLLVMKSVTDPADKVAIAKAKSIGGRDKAVKSEASQKAMIRNTKNVGKRAGKEVKKVKDAKYAKSQASQDAQRMRDKNAITKAKILKNKANRKDVAEGKNIPVIKSAKKVSKKYVRKSEATQKAYNKKADKASGVPQGAYEKRQPIQDVLTPRTNKNIKKSVEGKPPVIKSEGKISKAPAKKLSPNAKKNIALGTGVAGVAGVLLKGKNKKDARDAEKNKAVVPPKQNAKPEVKKPNVKAPAVKKPVRNKFNEKPNKNGKPEVKKPTGKVPSVASVIDKNPNSKKLTGRDKQVVAEKMRKHIAKSKKSNIPWEKILESLTMIMSSYILSKGISKRYK